MTPERMQLLLDRQRTHGLEFSLIDEMTPDFTEALANLALAARADEIAENEFMCGSGDCESTNQRAYDKWQLAKAERRSALAAVFTEMQP